MDFVVSKKRKPAKEVKELKKKLPNQIIEIENTVQDFRFMEMPVYKSKQPMILCPDMSIIVEAFNPLYKVAFEFLMCIAEPTNRSEYIHEYTITEMSLYTAMVVEYSCSDILRVLDLLSQNHPPEEMVRFIKKHTENMGQARFYLKNGVYIVDIGVQILDDVRSRLRDKDILSLEMECEDIERERNPDLIQLEQMVVDNHLLDQMADEINTNIDYARNQPNDHISYKRFAISGDYFQVTAALLQAFVPLIQEYDYTKELNEPLNIQMRANINPRPYQLRAVKNVIINQKARSGLIVLPCGAGKTMVGILILETIKASAIIICDSNVSVDQWKREINQYTTIDPNKIVRVTGYAKDKWPTGPIVVLTTYSWLIAQMLPNKVFKPNSPWHSIIQNLWGICIVDEVHRLPALQFCNVLKTVKCAIKIGLTATLLREDQKLDNLYFMIGPKLYEENLIDLMNQGYLAKPHIVEILCEMTPIFKQEYAVRPNNIRQLLHSGNPTKYRVLQFLIKHHEMLSHKIIVFCDSLLILNYYANKLGYPVIDGDLNTDEKNKIFNIFKSSNEIKTIFVSRVGDTGIDIPQASVGIEIGYLGGSRRQKVQRLGRVMRPKNSPDDISAFFYSLASKDTSESAYSFKRQKYITEQLGLNTELINEIDLPYNQNPTKYPFIKTMQDIDLLEEILTKSKDIQAEEEPDIVQEQRTFQDEIAGLFKFNN